MQQLLTPREFAAIVKVSPFSVWRWIRSEGMPARSRGTEEQPRYLCDDESYRWYIRHKTKPANGASKKAYPEYSSLAR